MMEFISKIADTAAWAVVGAAVFGGILRLIQSAQASHHHQDPDKPAVMKTGST